MLSPTTESVSTTPALVFNAVSISGKLIGKTTRKQSTGLNDVSFVVGEGESVGILGSAADGVTLLKAAASGVTSPATGQVFVRSQPALIDAESAFDSNETLRSNMERVAMSLELNGTRLKAAVERILKRFEMEDLAETQCGEMDPLEIERVRLATHLHAGPSLLIIEEPVARGRALNDEDGRQGIERHLRLGGSLLLAGRDPQLLRKVCSRIIWLHQGGIIMDGPSVEVTRKFGRLESLRGDKTKTSQLYRRYARQYLGLQIITESE
ncbi:ATP-binding cassette domain-containing protein [Arthrobacter rhombi]|uniref:ATP-binding cassette domain-containing protein n=1 Tax=Arthrobacter rhombi TaxID=71253 RepID=UPI003FD503E2